ncbi:MAG: DUF465 domain-containing protein [Hellea sp.]|nr:DUF465 domain-containing protein [Hellea sp.]
MAVTAYLTELKNKHAKIDQKIKQEQKSPSPDTILLTALKKQKLQLKEKISATAD